MVLAEDQYVVVYGGASLHSPKGLLHLIMEDTTSGCGSKEHPLHPVKPLVCLDDGFVLGFLRQWELKEPHCHVHLAEHLGPLQAVPHLLWLPHVELGPLHAHIHGY